MSDFLLTIGLVVNVLMITVLLIHFKMKKPFWPPPNPSAWQIHWVWWSVRIVVICIIGLAIKEWGALGIPDSIRFYLALPLFLGSFVLGTVGFVHLGWRNTHGEADKFVQSGIYRFSRNPQYVLYSISFVSLGILVASWQAILLLVVLSGWYLVAPYPEEKWLEAHYGEEYLAYKQKVSRYIGWSKRA